METLERSRVCRLCGKHAGITIDIFEKRGDHVKKINSVLPILVHEMDLLPKHICQSCNHKLHGFHKFYEDCLKTDANFKGQLSWMRGSVEHEGAGVPMVQINNFMIKSEPPDYDDYQESTEAIFHSIDLRSHAKNNYSEKIISSSSSSTKCSRCGCYCGKRNRIDEQLAKTEGITRAVVKHSNEMKKNNEQFTPRDTVRRNLFATEIFADKNPRIQTEIPIGNIPQGAAMRDDGEAERNARARLGCRQKGGRVGRKLKMADETKIPSVVRTLRPRKTDGPTDRGAAVFVTGRNSDIDRIESNPFKSLEIKVEAPEDFEQRTLRPRIEVIDYSDSKRKNPMARTIDGRDKKPPIDDRHFSTKVERKVDENLSNYVRSKTNSVDLTIGISPGFEKSTKISDTWKPLKNAKQKGAKKILRDSLPNMVVKNISQGRRFNVSRRRTLPENRTYDSPYLRSHRSQLRSGKLKKIDSVVDEPKKTPSNNVPRRISLESIKREKCEVNEKPSQAIFKRRNCNACNIRFASAELYMLHNCYGNKRH